MKSRSASPQTSPQLVRRFRLDSSSAGAAAQNPPNARKVSLRFEDLSAVTAMNGFTSFSGSPAAATTPQPNSLLSPITNVTRRVHNGDSSPSRSLDSQPNGTATPSPSATTLSPTDSVRESSPAASWSAIGHATTSGKSGRVIERLMAENDKLKRELNAQIIKSEELQRSLQTYKPQIEALRAENDNLSHARGVDSSLIARRDRRIEELRTEVKEEKGRREKAEKLARVREREKDEAVESSRRDTRRAQEEAKHDRVHAEIMETSHRQLAQEYRSRAEHFKHEMEQLQDGREADRQKLARLEVVCEQMRQEGETNRKAHSQLVGKWNALEEANQQQMAEWAAEANGETEKVGRLSKDMDTVVNEMRWLMGLKKNTSIST